MTRHGTDAKPGPPPLSPVGPDGQPEGFLTADLFYLALSLLRVALFQCPAQRWLAHLPPRP